MADTNFLLGGYDAKNCPERLRKTLDPAYADVVKDPIPAGDLARMEAGVVFEQDVKKAWSKALGRKMAIVDECDRSEKSKRKRERQTLKLLADPGDAIVIWNARLPQQFKTHRTGEPDALLLIGRDDKGKPMWVPVDVKDHASLEGTRNQNALVSSLRNPHPDKATSVDLGGGTPRKVDALQLAHYQRMLEHLGFSAPGRNIGGIVGREMQVVWHQLDKALYRHHHLGTASALDYYDYEFESRVELAIAAINGTSTPSPEWKSECSSCQWRTACHDELKLDLDHITLLPGITPTRARVHYDRGVTTVDQLSRLDWRTAALVDASVPVDKLLVWAAETDPATPVSAMKTLNAGHLSALSAYGVSSVGDVKTLDTKTCEYAGTKVFSLASSIDQARVAKVGKVHRARGINHVGFERVSIEEDFDIEDYQGYVYLIGVRDTGRKKVGEDTKIRAEYHAFVNWDGTADGEARVFAEFWAHVNKMRKKAADNKWGYRAYHFTHHEPSTFKQLSIRHAGFEGVPTLDEVEKFFDSRDVVDLYPILSKDLVWPTESVTLKEVAKWVRFSWRDSDPGGGNSLAWYQEAVANPDESVREEYRTRLLEYNADDCHAQVAVRDWLSRLGEARQPGKRLPGVEELDKRFARRR